MDLAGRWDLVIEQGATLERFFRWEDSTGVPIDISSYTPRMKIRKTLSSATAIASSDTTITLTKPGATGVVKIAMTAADTANLSFFRGVYDIELVNGAVVYRIVQGNVELSREATY